MAARDQASVGAEHAPSAEDGPRAEHGRGWFDAHCHLQERYLSEDAGDGAEAPSETDGAEPVARALGRAWRAGVTGMICVGTDAGTSHQALTLAADAFQVGPAGATPEVWATVGLHPHEADSGLSEVEQLLEQALAARGTKVVAVGECGLDYYYEHSSRQAQRSVFAHQITLAHRHGLTLVIHARDAWDDLFSVLGAEGVPERTVLHCFTGGPAEVRRCLAAGMFVSFSGIVTFKNARDVREAARICPTDRLMVETDSPFLAPVPFRGRTNEPAFVPYVGAAVANVRGVSVPELLHTSARATCTAFGLTPFT
jgi:TatD DNase family protein